uniref:Uncharacterized protein n=1 Tax=Panagrolaimus sp. PS1159 TaxID=55785 RepID=A0AC35GPE5_9BILA
MSALTSAFTTFTCIFLLAAFFSPNVYASADDFDIKTKAGSKVCVGKICDDSNAFYYFECCGTIFDDCCLKLQTWVVIVLIISAILILLGAIGGIIRCICCCDRR